MQRADLVVHQGYQRRDNNRHAMTRVLPCNRRDLVTQRLAATSWHQDQRVTAIHHMIHDGGLGATKVGIAKDLTQDVERGGLMVCKMHGFSQFGLIYMLFIQELLTSVSIGIEANLIGKKGCFYVFLGTTSAKTIRKSTFAPKAGRQSASPTGLSA